ncbi:two-component sensor histidine kinase [Novosphingobium sp. G106]|nr:two-component sensor histidine kinase [Novosphingobium sp. G106]
MMLAVAVALLAAQLIGAVLAYRAGAERREAALLHSAAFRLLSARDDDDRAQGRPPRDAGRGRGPDFGPGFRGGGGGGGFRSERAIASPQQAGDVRDSEAEGELRHILADQDFAVADVIVLRRAIARDEVASRRLERQRRVLVAQHEQQPTQVVVAAVKIPERDGWIVARAIVPPGERAIVISLLLQTLFIYVVLVGAIALILRRITRPLEALTERLERFTETRNPDGQLEPEGPDDVRRLIVAHNAMEARIAALLDEKDVMLGAIGHDLKTPLAALRVRIESVEDDIERARMAATIEDIVRSLDDILSLARVGRPSDPLEKSEISALVASVVEEYEDMGEPVELNDMPRIVLPVRSTWLRRGLRNLIDNALRYGQRARVSLVRETRQAVIWIEDDGPGIAEADIERMMEPFSRGEPSRNSATGGAGLGLTLARAIAEQHGGSLALANRRSADGKVVGLVATISLPL